MEGLNVYPDNLISTYDLHNISLANPTQISIQDLELVLSKMTAAMFWAGESVSHHKAMFFSLYITEANMATGKHESVDTGVRRTMDPVPSVNQTTYGIVYHEVASPSVSLNHHNYMP
jgi:hypothetical protein